MKREAVGNCIRLLPLGWGSEQPDPVEDVPAHCRVVGLDDL